jgi:hypothetical protein
VITVTLSGSFKNTERFFKNMSSFSAEKILEKYAQEGVSALSQSTPELTGLTAASWAYEVSVDKEYYSITWTNDNLVDGIPVAILLQYGHMTGTGGYVQGYDYINPSLQPIFDKIADDVWKEVKSA